MWELDYKESWAQKNRCFWNVVLEKTLEGPLDCKEIQPVHSEGDQSWVFIGRTDAEAETPILWPPDVKSWLIWKDPGARKDWGQEEKGTTENEMAGWHHRLDGHGFGWTLGVGDGQGGLACCGSWGHKESDRTERLNWTEIQSQISPLIWGPQFSLDIIKSTHSLFLSFLGLKIDNWNYIIGQVEKENIYMCLHIYCCLSLGEFATLQNSCEELKTTTIF